MRTPASSSARASPIATPFGVAKNTTSHFFSAASSGCVNASDDAAAQAREQRAHRRARFLARGDRREFDLRMLREQPQQLDAGISGAADDSGLDHVASPS